MSPEEFWLEFDLRNRKSRAQRTGMGGLSAMDWDAARAAHKAKRDGRNNPPTH